jgi:hypothetical protein
MCRAVDRSAGRWQAWRMAALGLRASFPWLSLLVLSGCASASNAAWLREPEEGLLLRDGAPNLETSATIAASASPRSAEASVVPNDARSRPRLRQTVTLGETIASAAEPTPAPAPGGNAAPVNVTVNNYVTAPAPAYGGWVEPLPGRAARSQAATPRGVSPPTTGGGASQPAGSWPSPPSYGPAFPFKTGPASPWR